MKDTRFALQHKLGLGGAVVVTVYARVDGKSNDMIDLAAIGQKTNLRCNPVIEARGFTKKQAESVRGQMKSSE